MASVRSEDTLRVSAAAVTSVVLDELLSHVHKEKAGILWDCLLSAARRRVELCNETGKQGCSWVQGPHL